MSIETNAFTDLEKAIAISVSEIVREHNFPESRIDLSIEFKDAMRIHSDTVIKYDEVEDRSAPFQASARLIFNSLFLSQDPVVYFDMVLPHEIAHLFADLTALNRGIKIKKHGTEWQDWMFNISHDPDLKNKIESPEFDNRAAISRGGGCVAACECDEINYIAFGIRSEEYKDLVEGNVHCQICRSPFEIISPAAVKGKLAEDINYLHSISGLRPFNSIEEVIEAFRS